MISINGDTLRAMILKALQRESVDKQVAEYVAEGLVSTSLRGVDSHGIRLIHHYLAALKAGRINPKPNYQIEKRSPTTALFDADHTFGHAAGMEAAKIAIDMAKEYGSGHVAVKNSSHFGAAAYFAIEIANKDMIGMSFTHSDALIIPYRGKRSFLGNNPICFTAPVKGEDPFCLDMATSKITFNKIRCLRETGEKAPEGAGADSDGNPTTDPNEITMLLPVGSYKGYGLSLMVEILCSMLTGMNYGPHILKMFDGDIHKKRRIGHFVSAINIASFQDIEVFKERIACLLNELRNEPPKNDEEKILVAGDPEKICERERIEKGIPLTEKELLQFKQLNEMYKLSLPLE